MTHTLGIHHVTAIAGDPQRNIDFYAGVLGLRFVKKTVNFDDPHSYHFYFGDERGTPGSLLTFFPWPGARHGRAGVGQAPVTSFAIPSGSLGYWIERLVGHGIRFEGPTRRFDEQVIAFVDPDGLHLELVMHAHAAARGSWSGAGVPAEHAIHGIHAVTAWVADPEPTAAVLTGPFGMREVGRDGNVTRYAALDGGSGTIIDLRGVGGFLRGTSGAGTVHHVAWRAADDAAQLALRAAVIDHGLRPTPVIDRTYFQSVYFREPGGVLFEIATDPPGLTVDEPLERLGEALMLPPQHEPLRRELETMLPEVHAPVTVAGGGAERR